MNHWYVLGLEPTDDSRLIKKAYAAKLKECHPEDNPEGFMQLQEAYKRALRQTNRSQAHIQSEPVQEPPTPQAELLDPSSWHCPRPPAQQAEKPVTPGEQFMALLEALCADEQQRQDPAAWRKLLHGNIQWPLDIAPLLQNRVMTILKASAPLPYEAWYGCNDLFGWAEADNLADVFTDEELIELFGNCQDANISQRVTDALYKQGTGYAACGDVQAALACYKKVLDWFGGSDIPAVRQSAAYAAGSLLLQLEPIADSLTVSQAEADLRRLIQTADGRIMKLALAESWLRGVLRPRNDHAEPVKVIRLCDKIIALFDKDEEEPPAIVAMALRNKAFYCRCLGQMEAAIAACDLTLQWFLDSDNEELRVHVVMALRNKAVYYENLGMTAQMLSVYEQAFQIFLNSENEEIRVHLVAMRVNQGCSYVALGRTKEALAVMNQVINKFSHSDNEEIRVQVAKALSNKSSCCSALGLMQEMAATCYQALQLFSNSKNEEIQLQVVVILYNQDRVYSKLGRLQEALAIVDQAINRFSGSGNEKIQEYVARAFSQKTFYCDQLGLKREMLVACEQALRLFLNSKNEQIEPSVAVILHNQGYAYSELGRMREALAVYDQLLSRFAHSTQADIRNTMAMARRKRRRVRRKLFWQDAPQWIWRSGVKLWNTCFRR